MEKNIVQKTKKANKPFDFKTKETQSDNTFIFKR